jgi:hypothetical protein
MPANDGTDRFENNSFSDGFFDRCSDLKLSEPALRLLCEAMGEGAGDNESAVAVDCCCCCCWEDEKFGSDNIGIERLFSADTALPISCCGVEGGGVEVGN